MEEPIEESYFNWLCAKVLSNHSNHLALMRILMQTEFAWVILGDKNRAEDGLELREYFLTETGLDPEQGFFDPVCSLLEMFIAFSDRASFQTEIHPKDWFWTFMRNLGLDEFSRVTGSDSSKIDDILHTFTWRTYDPDGHGGMFPLRSPMRNQKEVEIWYQFCDYLVDQGLL